MTYLALDLGEKQIGLALTDRLHMIATPHEVMPRRSRREDFETIAAVVAQHQVTLLVVGLPLLLSGEMGPMATWAQDYGRDLAQTIGIPVIFWDETLTSDLAEQALRQRGLSKKKMKQSGKLDATAAALILQSYLDAQRDPFAPDHDIFGEDDGESCEP